MKQKVLLTICIVMMAFASHAQASSSSATSKRLWTLKECVDYALANNLQVKRSEYNVQTATVNANQAKFNLLPTANAQGNTGYNWGRGLDPVSNQFVASQRNGFTSVGGQSSVTLFNGLRLQSNIKQSVRDREASEMDLAKSQNDVSLNVVTLFLNVLFYKEQVQNAQYQLGSSQQQLDRTKKQVAAGSLPKSNELNLEAQVATNELNVINQENSLNLALLQLQQALQLPASDDFDVETPDITPEDLLVDQSRDEIFQTAKTTMPEVKAASLRTESSYYAVRAARGNLLPRLSLNGSINSNYSSASETRFVSDGGFVQQQTGMFVQGTNEPIYALQPTGTFQNIYGINDQLKDNIYKSVSLTLNIPIFNNFSSRAALQRSIIQNEVARISAKEIDNTLRQNIETAYNNAVAASKTYNSTTKQVQAREEAFRITKQRYDIGAANYVEYQVSENDLFQAKSDLARAKYDFIFRKKLLDFYQGKPLGF
jgi:outer membrane protein